MWICSGDIGDQTRKLSEIAPNFALTNFRGRAYPKNCAETDSARSIMFDVMFQNTSASMSRDYSRAHTFLDNLIDAM